MNAFASRFCRRLWPVTLVASALSLIGSGSARADLIIEAPNVVARVGQSGSFDILLVNTTPSTTTFQVAGDSVEIALTGVSGVTFTAATIATATPYLYVQSSTLGPPVTPLSFDSFPNTSFTASDAEFGPLGYRSIAPQATFGLVHVSYSVSASALPTTMGLISFLAAGTSLSDTNGNAIPFTTQNGTFAITSSAAVPEPGSLALLLVAGVGLGVLGRSRRARSGN